MSQRKKLPPQPDLISDLVAAAEQGGVSAPPPAPEPAAPPPTEDPAPKAPRKAPESNPVTLYEPPHCGHADCLSTDILKKDVINREQMTYRVRCRKCGRYSVIKARYRLPYTPSAFHA